MPAAYPPSDPRTSHKRIDAILQSCGSDSLFNFDAEPFRTATRNILQAGWDARRVELGSYIDFTDLDVLEIGCGQCWHAPLMLWGGARSYRGLDIEVPLDSNSIPNISATAAAHVSDRTILDSPLSLGRYLGAFPGIDVQVADISSPPWPEGCVDAAFMLTVSEHLPDVGGALDVIADMLRPGGLLYITHGNYYSWSGHHIHPQSESDFDASSPAHNAVVDWGHVKRFVDSAQIDSLNFIRLHELVELLERRFTVLRKENLPLAEGRGAGRLTNEIRKALPAYYEEELTTEQAVFLCQRRDGLAKAPARAAPRTPEDHDVVVGDSSTTVTLTWMSPESGSCFWTRLPRRFAVPEAVLTEDSVVLGPANSIHDVVRQDGGGAFSVWGDYLYFSSTDDTNPASNGRKYELHVPMK